MDHVVIGPEYRGAVGLLDTGDRHERRKRRTRHLIFEAAVRLFVEKGYEETTMEEIAEAADVARATVFNHVPRKHRLVAYWAGLRVAPLVRLWQSKEFRERGTREQILGFMAELAEMNE
ncbi:MAG: helix-turn-helix transcriptional regulator, partial [Chloroflexi bacterium]|nr:helix-turn-helix transcriptional regulator [Chloroflexota bacterium]